MSQEEGKNLLYPLESVSLPPNTYRKSKLILWSCRGSLLVVIRICFISTGRMDRLFFPMDPRQLKFRDDLSEMLSRRCREKGLNISTQLRAQQRRGRSVLTTSLIFRYSQRLSQHIWYVNLLKVNDIYIPQVLTDQVPIIKRSFTNWESSYIFELSFMLG